MQKAQEAKDGLGAQDWLIEKLIDSGAFAALNVAQVIECLIGEYCDPHVGHELIDRLIDEEIAKKEAEALKRVEEESERALTVTADAEVKAEAEAEDARAVDLSGASLDKMD